MYLFNIILIHLQEENLRLIAKFTNVFESDPFRSLVGLLGYHGLLTERFSILVSDHFLSYTNGEGKV